VLITFCWLEERVDVDVVTLSEGAAVIGSVKVGRVTGFGLVITVVSGMMGMARSYSTIFPGVGSTELLLTEGDISGLLMDLWAFSSSTRPKIRPSNARSPNRAKSIGVQHVFFSRVGGMIGGAEVFGA
jgi:hypothetical protein